MKKRQVGKTPSILKTIKNNKEKAILLLVGVLSIVLYIFWGSEDGDINLQELEYIVSLPSDTRKLPLQLADPVKEFNQSYSEKHIEAVRKRNVIVQSFYKGKLVANVFIVPYRYTDSASSENNLVLVFEIYNVYVAPKYRGKRLSIPHLYRTCKMLKEVYRVTDTRKCFLSLHISPMDKDMDKAYALYRTNGFLYGLFTDEGSYSIRNKAEVFINPKSVDSVVTNHPYYNKEYTGEKQITGPKYLTMFTNIETFFKTVEMKAYTKSDYNYHKKKVQNLKKPLLQQYKYR